MCQLCTEMCGVSSDYIYEVLLTKERSRGCSEGWMTVNATTLVPFWWFTSQVA